MYSVEGLDLNEYNELQALYAKWQSWYNGNALKVKKLIGDNYIPIYPLEINPIRGMLDKFADFTVGNTQNSVKKTSVSFVLKDKNKKRVIDDDLTAYIDEVISHLNWHSIALDMFIYGGCFLKCEFLEKSMLYNENIVINAVSPRNAHAAWYSDGTIRKFWQILPISSEEAYERYGIIVDEFSFYIEYWDIFSHKTYINDNLVTNIPIPGTEEKIILDERNPYGFVPVVYLPRIKQTDSPWSTSAITNSAIGIVKELNQRVADAGDESLSSSHKKLIGRNLKETPYTVRVDSTTNVLMIGTAQAVPGQQPILPEVTSVDTGNPLTSIISLIDTLYLLLRREMNMPAVADGEDEGSQRSGETLYMRMMPIFNVVSIARANIARYLFIAIKFAIRMANIELAKDFREDYKIDILFSDVIDKSRESVVNEAVQRKSSGLGSIEKLLEMLGDDDAKETIAQIARENNVVSAANATELQTEANRGDTVFRYYKFNQ